MSFFCLICGNDIGLVPILNERTWCATGFSISGQDVASIFACSDVCLAQRPDMKSCRHIDQTSVWRGRLDDGGRSHATMPPHMCVLMDTPTPAHTHTGPPSFCKQECCLSFNFTPEQHTQPLSCVPDHTHTDAHTYTHPGML